MNDQTRRCPLAGPGTCSELVLDAFVQLGDQGIAEGRGGHRLLAGDQLAVDHHIGVPVGYGFDAGAGLRQGVDGVVLDVPPRPFGPSSACSSPVAKTVRR